MSLDKNQAGKSPCFDSPDPAPEPESGQEALPDSGGAWFVYLLQCADGTLYCGVTTDLSRRVDQHNGLVPGGARYTRARRPVVLAAWAPADDRSTAQKMEYRIRRMPRGRKVAALKALALNEVRSPGCD